MPCAQALATGEGLENATWAMLGTVTTVEFGRLFATALPDAFGVSVSEGSQHPWQS